MRGVPAGLIAATVAWIAAVAIVILLVVHG